MITANDRHCEARVIKRMACCHCGFAQPDNNIEGKKIYVRFYRRKRERLTINKLSFFSVLSFRHTHQFK